VADATGERVMAEDLFNGKNVTDWDAVSRNEEVPSGLFETFNTSAGLLKASLKHRDSSVRAAAATFLRTFEDEFDHRIVRERDDQGKPRSWRIDEKEYPIYEQAARDVAFGLADALRDESKEVRRLATMALQNFGRQAAPAVSVGAGPDKSGRDFTGLKCEVRGRRRRRGAL